MEDRDKKFAEIVAKLEGKLKRKIVMKANEIPDIPRIPTGVAPLDIAIGGGLPRGKLVIFEGQEKAGKSTTALIAMATAQKLCRKCFLPADQCEHHEPHRVLLIDGEHSFDRAWAATNGVDISALNVVVPESLEEQFDVFRVFLSEDVVDLIVVDSIVSLAPEVENEKDANEAVIGVQARELNRLVRQIATAFCSMSTNGILPPSIVFVNQLRAKVGSPFPDYVLPGGKGQTYLARAIVRFESRKYETEVDKNKEKFGVWQQIGFLVRQSTISPPKRTGEYRLWCIEKDGNPAGYLDEAKSIVEYGIALGVIKQGKGKWAAAGIEGATKQAFLKSITENPMALWTLRQEVLKLAVVEGMKYQEKE